MEDLWAANLVKNLSHLSCHHSFSNRTTPENKWLFNMLRVLLSALLLSVYVGSRLAVFSTASSSSPHSNLNIPQGSLGFFPHSFSSPPWCISNCCCAFGHNRLALQWICRTVSLFSAGPDTNRKRGPFYSYVKPVRFWDVSVCGWKQTWHYLFQCPTNGVR